MRKRLMARLIRLVQAPRILFYRALSTARVIGRPHLIQPVQFLGEGEIRLSPNVTFGVHPSPMLFSGYGYVEARYSTARISIGQDTWINNNFVAVAEYRSIEIGSRVLMGSCVEIYDSDFHGLKVEERRRSDPAYAADVVIGNDVFLGSNVKILKGVHIGDGSVIGAGAVVTKSIPAGVIAGGNPARVIRPIE